MIGCSLQALWRGTDTEEYVARQAHRELAERIRQRDPGDVSIAHFLPTNRVEYVFLPCGVS